MGITLANDISTLRLHDDGIAMLEFSNSLQFIIMFSDTNFEANINRNILQSLRMEQAVKCLFEERLRQTRHLKEMEVVDPRTDEEKERAEELRKRVLCMIATAGRREYVWRWTWWRWWWHLITLTVPPPVATNVIAQDEEPDEKGDRVARCFNTKCRWNSSLKCRSFYQWM